MEQDLQTSVLHSSIDLLSAHLYTNLASGLQERRKQQDLHRRVEKVQRVVNASPEIALAGRLQRLLGAADVHVHEVEQSCIMTQWMLQEVADIGISGLRWSPAKVGGALGLLNHVRVKPPGGLAKCALLEGYHLLSR